MAIQVSGTEVISNARNISNVGTVTATSFVGSGAGLTGLSYAPLPPTWNPASTPNVTYTSSTTWTKPALASDTWVIFYTVGGGAAGSAGFYSAGGSGGGASIIVGILGELPSSISITVGAGGVSGGGGGYMGGTGGSTVLSASGITFTSNGGVTNSTLTPGGGVVFPIPANPFSITPTVANIYGGSGGQRANDGVGAIYGGGGGGGGYGSGTYIGGTSTYAGSGGTGRQNTAANNGGFPGGGGGGCLNSTRGAGGNGVVKVWYL